MHKQMTLRILHVKTNGRKQNSSSVTDQAVLSIFAPLTERLYIDQSSIYLFLLTTCDKSKQNRTKESKINKTTPCALEQWM